MCWLLLFQNCLVFPTNFPPGKKGANRSNDWSFCYGQRIRGHPPHHQFPGKINLSIPFYPHWISDKFFTHFGEKGKNVLWHPPDIFHFAYSEKMITSFYYLNYISAWEYFGAKGMNFKYNFHYFFINKNCWKWAFFFFLFNHHESAICRQLRV